MQGGDLQFCRFGLVLFIGLVSCKSTAGLPTSESASWSKPVDDEEASVSVLRSEVHVCVPERLLYRMLRKAGAFAVQRALSGLIHSGDAESAVQAQALLDLIEQLRMMPQSEAIELATRPRTEIEALVTVLLVPFGGSEHISGVCAEHVARLRAEDPDVARILGRELTKAGAAVSGGFESVITREEYREAIRNAIGAVSGLPLADEHGRDVEDRVLQEQLDSWLRRVE